MIKNLIQKQDLPDYRKELTRLFRIRVNLFCYITIFAFCLELVLAKTFLKGIVSFKDMPGIIVGIIYATILLITARFAKTLIRQKARAFSFSIVLVLIAVLAAVAHPNLVTYMGISLVLLALFPGILMLPWNWIEATIIGIFALVSYMLVSRATKTYVTDEIFIINSTFLAVAVFINALVKRSQDILRQKDFAAEKDLEKKSLIMLKELELAKKIHKSLIPKSISNDLVDIAVTYKPMFYMGGDYAKFHFIDNDKLIFVLADITGHGVSAALLVNRIHTEIERLVREGLSPGELLKQLDEFIDRDFGKIGTFLTAFCGLLDFSQKKLIYSNHGHPPQILLHSKDNGIILMESQTFLMGIGLEAGNIYHNEISFDAGDRIILFTDGIIEARNKKNEFFGQENLEGFTKENSPLSVVEFNEKLISDLALFQEGRQDDDIFLLTIQTK